MSTRDLGVALLLSTGLWGCNSLFGITPGEPAAGGGGAGGIGASEGGSGGADEGGGGSAPACLPERPDMCDPALLDDPENCCAAGRSCQGSSCTAGECGPVTIATASMEEQVVDVLALGEHLFWSTGAGATLKLLSVDGGISYDHATSNDFPQTFVTRLAADAEHVYWTNFGSGRIARVPLAGGGVEIVSEIPAAVQMLPKAGFGQIALGGGYVFWASQDSGGLWRADLQTVPSTPVLMDDLMFARGVSTDATHVYWGRDDGSIVRASLRDPTFAPEAVVAGQPNVRAVHVIEDRVVWGGYGFMRSAVKDGLNELIVTYYDQAGLSEPYGIAGDARDLYFTAASEDPARIAGGLFRTSFAGGGALVSLATIAGNGAMLGVAIDCDTVYVASFDDELLFKITR